VVAPEIFILTSSITGIVEKEEIIDGSSIEEQDAVLCLESNGFHTNGYTLVRRIISENPEITEASIGNESFLESVLKPHRCYYQCLKGLFKQRIIKGLAHITGGGIKENLDRILPGTFDAEIDLHLYAILPVCDFLKKRFNIDDNEMLRTFNMEVGMALVTRRTHVNTIISHIEKFGIYCYPIGLIIKGTGKVHFINTLPW
jgi:phosphoribosylformylglycinamidine cyclo-ligase